MRKLIVSSLMVAVANAALAFFIGDGGLPGKKLLHEEVDGVYGLDCGQTVTVGTCTAPVAAADCPTVFAGCGTSAGVTCLGCTPPNTDLLCSGPIAKNGSNCTAGTTTCCAQNTCLTYTGIIGYGCSCNGPAAAPAGTQILQKSITRLRRVRELDRSHVAFRRSTRKSTIISGFFGIAFCKCVKQVVFTLDLNGGEDHISLCNCVARSLIGEG